MPTETILVLAGIIAMFAYFSSILIYGSSVAPPTFPEDQSAHRRTANRGKLVEAH